MLPVLIYITTPNREEAISLSHELLNKKLIACANIIDHITSIYRWMGQLEQNNESILIAKTISQHVEKVTEYVRQHHTYECPAIITVPITDGNPEYLDWIAQQVTPLEN